MLLWLWNPGRNPQRRFAYSSLFSIFLFLQGLQGSPQICFLPWAWKQGERGAGHSAGMPQGWDGSTWPAGRAQTHSPIQSFTTCLSSVTFGLNFVFVFEIKEQWWASGSPWSRRGVWWVSLEIQSMRGAARQDCVPRALSTAGDSWSHLGRLWPRGRAGLILELRFEERSRSVGGQALVGVFEVEESGCANACKLRWAQCLGGCEWSGLTRAWNVEVMWKMIWGVWAQGVGGLMTRLRSVAFVQVAVYGEPLKVFGWGGYDYQYQAG